MTRRPFLLVVATLLALRAWAGADPIAVHAAPVPLNPDDPAQDSVGVLRYRGGLALSSPDRRFGGFSSLRVSRDGKDLIAVSDEGHWLTARPLFDRSGALAGIEEARLDRLMGPDGRPLAGKELHDAESLAVMPDGSLVVGFEQRHRLLSYPAGRRPFEKRPRLLAAPPDLAGAPANGGVESLVALAGGDLFALAEEWVDNGRAHGWVRRKGRWLRLWYPVEGPMRASDAAALPTGDVVVLERGYTKARGIVGVRLRLVAGDTIGEGATLGGALLAELAAPLTVDNFEGVAVRAGGNGETLLLLLSDDNFNRDQRTLLLMFELPRR